MCPGGALAGMLIAIALITMTKSYPSKQAVAGRFNLDDLPAVHTHGSTCGYLCPLSCTTIFYLPYHICPNQARVLPTFRFIWPISSQKPCTGRFITLFLSTPYDSSGWYFSAFLDQPARIQRSNQPRPLRHLWCPLTLICRSRDITGYSCVQQMYLRRRFSCTIFASDPRISTSSGTSGDPALCLKLRPQISRQT